MSFDKDTSEQANISGADLAIMVDEIKTLKAQRDELRDACKTMIAWDDAEKHAPPYKSDNGAHWRMRLDLCKYAFEKARAALASVDTGDFARCGTCGDRRFVGSYASAEPCPDCFASAMPTDFDRRQIKRAMATERSRRMSGPKPGEIA